MKSMNKFFTAICLGSLLVLSSCENAELDLASNPNALSPDQASADFFLNAIQEDFARWAHSLGHRGGALTRINYMSGRTYANVYSPNGFDGVWSDAYKGMLKDIQLMSVLSAERPYALGMGEVFEAYIYITLVDYFGDVPQAEALDAEGGVLNPSASPGADVYAYAIGKLDSAIANFTTGGGAPANDFFYGGDASKWIKAANSLKKKAYLNMGNSSAYNGVTNYISSAADDFQFSWGVNEAQPDTRHPYYGGSYTPTGGGYYMANWFMHTLQQGHGGVGDPRIFYYFYRQVQNVPGFGIDADEEVLECGLDNYYNPYANLAPPLNAVFCGLNGGYWGRDHGNDNGIPPDGFQRTLHGVYPAGGKYDDRSYSSQKNGAGAGGRGITPIMLSSWMHFMNAEVAGVGTAAGTTEVLAGIQASINKAASLGGDALNSATVDSYVAAFAAEWTAGSTEDKNNLWATQFLISLYGNGTDGYNMYRRTGYPRTLQPNIEPSPGAYPVSMWYPANYTTNNSNATQKSDLTGRVFWNTSGPSNLY